MRQPSSSAEYRMTEAGSGGFWASNRYRRGAMRYLERFGSNPWPRPIGKSRRSGSCLIIAILIGFVLAILIVALAGTKLRCDRDDRSVRRSREETRHGSERAEDDRLEPSLKLEPMSDKRNVVIVVGALNECSKEVFLDRAKILGYQAQFLNGDYSAGSGQISIYPADLGVHASQHDSQPWQAALYLPARFAPEFTTKGRWAALSRRFLTEDATNGFQRVVDGVPDDVLLLLGFSVSNGTVTSRPMVLDVDCDVSVPTLFVAGESPGRLSIECLRIEEAVSDAIGERIDCETVRGVVAVPDGSGMLWGLYFKKLKVPNLSDAGSIEVEFPGGAFSAIVPLELIPSEAYGLVVAGFSTERPLPFLIGNDNARLDFVSSSECKTRFFVVPTRIPSEGQQGIQGEGRPTSPSMQARPSTATVRFVTEHLRLPAAHMAISVSTDNGEATTLHADVEGEFKFLVGSKIELSSMLYHSEKVAFDSSVVFVKHRHGLLGELYQASRLGKSKNILEFTPEGEVDTEIECVMKLLDADTRLMMGANIDIGTELDIADTGSCKDGIAELSSRIDEMKSWSNKHVGRQPGLNQVALIVTQRAQGPRKDRLYYTNRLVPMVRIIDGQASRGLRDSGRSRSGLLVSFADSSRWPGHVVRFLVEPLLYDLHKPEETTVVAAEDTDYPEVWVWLPGSPGESFKRLLQRLTEAGIQRLAVVVESANQPSVVALLDITGIQYECFRAVRNGPAYKPWVYIASNSWQRCNELLTEEFLESLGNDMEIRALRYLFLVTG